MAEVVVVVHISEACHSPDHGVGLGIDPLAVRVHFLLLDLVRFEGMTSLELIVPRRACTSLIQKRVSLPSVVPLSSWLSICQEKRVLV
jgi:hypothetical protein